MCPLLSVRFYSFYFFIRFSMNIFFPKIPLRWWAQVDSNHRPRAYQARALTTWAMSPLSYSMYLVSLAFVFSPLLFVFRRPSIGSGNLPVVEMMGFEPMTPCLQGRCSPNWATPPFRGFRSLKIEQPRSKYSAYTVLRLLITFWLFTIRHIRENVSVSP